MINTTIFMNSRPAYTLSTALQGSTTDISTSRTSEILVFFPNTIAFPSINNGKEIRLSKWMSRQKLSDGLHVHVIKTEIGKCFLRKHSVHRLALFTEYDCENPVAHWDRPNATSPISLNFHPQIIAAFTIQELRMRMAEEGRLGCSQRAAAQATPIATLGHRK
ncbi:hypothetical protein B0H17DRAFT_1102383 [Mycena rosella]|uniref:Uncharacterized protein n=1 Tax=Mycena rosella TaxID=1033263 RepID=A0AAD7CHK1_MYCRO|nr:hypothetical protein B0H17DRAFT_1102383 [Mycena rosella]